MSATNAFETSLLGLIFNNTDAANVGDAAGLQNSATAGVFWISLHTSSPGEGGSQNTNEADYTSYARVSINRASGAGGFTVSGANASNASAVTFPAKTGGADDVVTHFGIGSDQTAAGNLFFYGALGASRTISDGVTPEFAVGELDINLD